jgi:hypothetical protein
MYVLCSEKSKDQSLQWQNTCITCDDFLSIFENVKCFLNDLFDIKNWVEIKNFG